MGTFRKTCYHGVGEAARGLVIAAHPAGAIESGRAKSDTRDKGAPRPACHVSLFRIPPEGDVDRWRNSTAQSDIQQKSDTKLKNAETSIEIKRNPKTSRQIAEN